MKRLLTEEEEMDAAIVASTGEEKPMGPDFDAIAKDMDAEGEELPEEEDLITFNASALIRMMEACREDFEGEDGDTELHEFAEMLTAKALDKEGEPIVVDDLEEMFEEVEEELTNPSQKKPPLKEAKKSKKININPETGLPPGIRWVDEKGVPIPLSRLRRMGDTRRQPAEAAGNYTLIYMSSGARAWLVSKTMNRDETLAYLLSNDRTEEEAEEDIASNDMIRVDEEGMEMLVPQRDNAVYSLVGDDERVLGHFGSLDETLASVEEEIENEKDREMVRKEIMNNEVASYDVIMWVPHNAR
ncbi:MAG: hypothetical protein JRI80_18260 [Deltaproteobacteria bacterium]|nr:hypothetical protein [Deltaproteobacteria bacterium]